MAERSCSTLKFDGRRCCKRPKVFIKKSVAPQETPVACCGGMKFSVPLPRSMPQPHSRHKYSAATREPQRYVFKLIIKLKCNIHTHSWKWTKWF